MISHHPYKVFCFSQKSTCKKSCKWNLLCFNDVWKLLRITIFNFRSSLVKIGENLHVHVQGKFLERNYHLLCFASREHCCEFSWVGDENCMGKKHCDKMTIFKIARTATSGTFFGYLTFLTPNFWFFVLFTGMNFGSRFQVAK